MNPELYTYIEKKLFDMGALDVYKTPIIMKKGRPGVKLSILVDKKDVENIEAIIFKESTSIGIRKYLVEKIMLKRDFSKVKTKYGDIRIKSAYYKGNRAKFKPEYEDCKKLAQENNIPIGEIYKEINKVVERNQNN